MDTTRFSSQIVLLIIVSLLLVACAGQASQPDEEDPAMGPGEATIAASTSPEEATPPDASTSAREQETATLPDSEPEATLLPEEPPPRGAEREFRTDFSIHSVPYSEILSGGPPKDGIPSIDEPAFVSVGEAGEWLVDVEPVIRVQIGDAVKAYPIQILMWHEIVNDSVGDMPVAVTFCPLCNTAIVLERTVDEQVLDFGTTGRLRFSNLVMYDRQTETWWQQATGKAIAGELTGRQLAFVPAEMIAWADFQAAHPDAQVLSRDTGFNRPYGNNPYLGYDNVNNPPFAYEGPATPGELLPMERVLTVELGDEAVAYPFNLLQEAHVVQDTVGTTDIVVMWEPGTASALDAGSVAEGRDIGSANGYERVVDGQTLTFTFDGEQIVDTQTGTVWNARGEAIEGKLAGQSLEPIVAVNHFWFSWAAFKPDTRVYQP